MEILLYKIVGLLQNWIILCPPEKKELLKTTLEEIKPSPKRVPTVAQLNLGRNQESQCWATWEDQVFGDVKDEEVAVDWAYREDSGGCLLIVLLSCCKGLQFFFPSEG